MSRPKRQASCHPNARHYGFSLCRLCYVRQYKAARRSYINRQQTDWRMRRGDAQRDYMRNYSKAHRQQDRDKRVLYQYGITSGEYDALLSKQDGKCAICSRLPQTVRLAIDHDHKTGKIRGLLCRQCNAALGLMQDRWEVLVAASNYLRGA